MGKLLIAFLILFSLGSTYAQEVGPKKVINKTQSEKSNAFVQEDEKTVIKTSQLQIINSNVQMIEQDLNAIKHSDYRNTPTHQEQLKMETNLNQIEVIDNQSFDYYLLNYQVGNYDFSKISSLNAAEKIFPNNPRVNIELAAYHYILSDSKGLKKNLEQLVAQNVFSQDLEDYAKDVLVSLPKNCVLMTYGEQDTYPLFIQQTLENIRPDVKIVCIDYLQNSEYKNRLKNEGFSLPNRSIVDTAYFASFLRMNTGQAIVVSGSVPQPYLIKGGKNIAVAGLGFNFSSNPAINSSYNQELYESTLKAVILSRCEKSPGHSKVLLGNYLPFLFDVRNSYLIKNNQSKVKEVEEIIIKIAKLTNKQSQVDKLLIR